MGQVDSRIPSGGSLSHEVLAIASRLVRWCSLGVMLVVMTTTLVPNESLHAQPQGMSPEQLERFREMRARRGNRGPRGVRPAQIQQQDSNNQEEKKEEDASEEGSDKKEEQKEDIATIKRPTDGSEVPDPDRPKLTPDENGLVQFNYLGQPWSVVLQDFADAGGYSFDWQELPADSLNLTTQRKYSLQEARDLLNRHLLARGFTLIVQGEVLTAVKVDKIDPSLIPRIAPDDLEDYPPHDFVRVRFDLPPSMDPAKAAEDVKVLLSPNAKVTPLLASKRLLVIDAVANQRSVRDLLYSEQMAANQSPKPKVYTIRHRRAEYVADQVLIILGIDPKARESAQEVQFERQEMQMLMQMQKQGADVSKLLGKDEPQIHIAVNRRQNSLLVNAPPELLPVIDRTIAELDVPDGGAVAPGETTGSSERYMEKYQTVTATPDSVMTALQEIGDLHPRTQLHTDSDSKTIYAYATSEDHETIKRMIDKLDGSGRSPEVIWLPKRLPADQVAGSITALIVGEQKEEEDDYPFFYRRRGRQQDEEPKTNFRVLPDVENNRLIVWATESELAEVRNLIDKLSETGDRSWGNASRVRLLESRDPETTRRLLERLKSTWPGENPLEIDIPPAEEEPTQPVPEAQPEEEDEPQDRITRLPGSEHEISHSKFLLAQTAAEADSDNADGESVEGEKTATDDGEAPPIKITVNEEGQLLITSDDPFALDQLEELIGQLAPPQPEFHWYKLDYMYADVVVDKLRDYFADELAEERDRPWWQSLGESDEPATLGKRSKLRFIDDYYTNSVIVSNASPSQLQIIEKLIDLYDQPPKREGFQKRKTEAIKIKHSRASDIAQSLKEVYADLLSANDKEFRDAEGRRSLGSNDSTRYAFGDATSQQDGSSPVIVRFQGALSIGVDEVSNTLLVSAREEVLQQIRQTVDMLDQAAQPDTTVHVHEIRGLISPDELQDALEDALGEPWPGGKPLSDVGDRGGGRRSRGRRGRR